MTKKPTPRLLDVFCGAGGAAFGYHLAGFEIVGVDSEPQPRYPFRFIQADAMEYLATADLSRYDVIHASPVCKAYTECNLSPKDRYPKLIGTVRRLLTQADVLYDIENVMGARHDLRATLLLCGSMFGLPIQRHRLFEIGGTDLFLCPPAPCDHRKATINVYGHSVWDSSLIGTPRKDGKRRPDSIPLAIGREAMGISWMGIGELAQAVPPAYTQFIGEQLLQIIPGYEKMEGEAS